jgi:hypothetical protein
VTSPVPILDPVAQPIIDAFLGCWEEQAARTPDPPAVVCLRPGDSVELLLSQLQNECCSGLAWLRPAGIYPSSDFPEQDSFVRKCQLGWAVVVELGLARCAPVGDSQHLPTCDQWAESVNHQMADAAAMRRALLCFQRLEEHRFTMALPGGWLPIRTEGGCLGGAMSFTFRADMCDVLED